MSDFIREVDEDYRRDKALEFWKTYGWMFILGAGLIILAVAGYTYFENAKKRELEAQATAFSIATQKLENGLKNDAVSGLKAMLAGELSPGYRSLVSLRLAQIKLDDGDRTAALGLYDAVATNSALPQSFRDLALVTSTSLQIDAMTSEEVLARLSGLTLGSDYKYSASELIGVSLLREGKDSEAVTYFQQLRQANDAPSTMRARAQTLLATLDEPALPDVSEAVIDTAPEAAAEAGE